MTDTPADTAPSGIAVLAVDEPAWEDGPFPVRGVALAEDVVVRGANTENVPTYWPPEVVEAATELFEGRKIVDGIEHDPQTMVEKPQPSPETIVGEITNVQYKPGVGVLYEGEVDDPELAKRIHRGRVEVSPSLFRTLGDLHDDGESHVVEAVAAVRDLTIVSHGAIPGNSIEAAPATAAMSLSVAALQEAFDAGEGGAEALQLTAEQVSLVEDALTEFVESQGNASLQTLQDWVFENEDLDTDTKVALEAALSEVFQSFDPAPGEFRMDLFREWLAGTETLGALIDTTTGAESSTDADGIGADPGDGGGQHTADRTNTGAMSNDNTLTDEQRKLLDAAESLGDYEVTDHGIVGSEYAEVLADAAGCDEPRAIETAEYSTLTDDLSEAKLVLAEALRQRDGMKLDAEKIAENFSWEALREEFLDDDGEFAPEALIQMPETGQPDDNGELDPEAEALAEEFGDGDVKEAVEVLQGRYEQYQRAGWESNAEQAKGQLEQLGVEVS